MLPTMIIFTLLLWGIAPIFDKAALRNGDPVLGTILRGIAIGAAMALFAIFSGKTKELFAMNGKTVVFFVVSGLIAGVLGVFTYFKALQMGPTSKIVPLAATYPLITALLGVLFLGEAITAARLLGVILIAGEIFLVK